MHILEIIYVIDWSRLFGRTSDSSANKWECWRTKFFYAITYTWWMKRIFQFWQSWQWCRRLRVSLDLISNWILKCTSISKIIKPPFESKDKCLCYIVEKHQQERMPLQWHKIDCLCLGDMMIEVEILIGTHIKNKILISRVILSPTHTKWPYKLGNCQFPIRIYYAMTIN